MSARPLRLASLVALPLVPTMWSCLAHQRCSTVQTSTSSTSRLVRHCTGRRVGKTTSLHVLSRSAHKGREFYAAHRFYDEDQARHRGRVLSLIHISEPTRLGMISYA